MKARVPVNVKREMKQEISRLVENEYNKVRDKENQDITRRIFKTVLFVLHKGFGFGHRRAMKVFDKLNDVIEHSNEDEVFWEHLDRTVIDKLGIPFEVRDYTDNGKVVSGKNKED